LKVILNQRIKIVYDTSDGKELDDHDLVWCDFYFKRSFDRGYVAHLPKREVIFPLGFNYPAYGPHDYSLVRLLWAIISSNSLSNLEKVLNSVFRLTALSDFLKTSSGRKNALYSNIEDLPRFDLPNRAIFFTRLWDPGRTQDLSLVEEREKMNQVRVEIIRKMRLHFGDHFLGGLEPTQYAVKYFGDCVVHDPRIVYKKNYMKLLRQASIGIATEGLQKSNGWKIAEYIAGSKAIVSRTLCYEIPGNFQAGENYLAFATSDEGIEQVSKLLNNPQLLFAMKVRNFVYYNSFLRPDVLIWNTLKIIQDKCAEID
jgi:hypothetical protein